ncbi:uncharacterized protein LOC121732799 [Aricia agestis]|uniref:uncharacterized protein LOC121732799 n=1 Tax=Aricia agestis TaxID=91739 RepID=UPI001C20A52F|nr:uncharacterized protein LOC121732799 [Aricia agestis]
MDRILLHNKVKLLFEKLTDPNFAMNSYYVDNFFIKMHSNDDEDVLHLKSLPCIIPTLLVDKWKNIDTYHKTVKVFLVRLLGLFVESEVSYARIFTTIGNDIAKDMKQINSPAIDNSLRVAYMEVALSLMNHNSGALWVIQNEIWKEILQMSYKKKTVFVVRQTNKFVSLFVWRLNDSGSLSQLKEVVSALLKPILGIEWLKVSTISTEEEDELCKTIEPMLHLLLSVMSDKEHIIQSNHVIEYFLENNVLTHFYLVLDRLRHEETTLILCKLLFWMTIAKMFHAKPLNSTVQYGREDLIEISVGFFNTLNFFISRRDTNIIFDYSIACNLIWASVWPNNKVASWEQGDRKIQVHTQLLVICLVPCLTYAMYDKTLRPDFEDKINDGITKIVEGACEHTARTSYCLRDLILQLDIQTLTLQSVKRLTCLKQHLNDDQANSLFKVLFYVFKKFDPLNESGELIPQDFSDDQEKVLIMYHVIDTMLALVTNYNIVWHESFEVLCLYGAVYDTLKRPNLSAKFVVTALNVISVTIKKFLPPNLSLLQESSPGSPMNDLGALIYLKMSDFHWEVRDSALELLLVCTELSYIKFPPFQRQILSNNLINLAMTIALNDHETYVRVSALKCLAAASRVASYWDQLKTEYPNVQELLLAILSNSEEGMVRKEACNVLCEIYQNVKLSPNFKVTLYDRMVASALSEFHWEVQLNALKFWKVVIQCFLKDQGMLDGTFPPVTFSKETRKIVTLNEKEIQKRLTRMLEELACIGCLTVLVKLLHDEYTEVDIMDAALSISTDILNILDKYNVPSCLKPNENEPKTVEDLMKHVKIDLISNDSMADEPQNLSKSDNVIESILDSNDINLLSHIYERQMKLQGDESSYTHRNQTRFLKFASPYLYVTYMKSKDFKEIIEQKKNWNDGIKSLSSLLDDVLGIYEVNDEVNALDCY